MKEYINESVKLFKGSPTEGKIGKRLSFEIHCHSERNLEKAKAYAKLIVESLNITNESGFSPKELLEQRGELVVVLKILRRRVLAGIISIRQKDMDLITKAIQKASYY